MKIGRIENLCKSAKRITIINDKSLRIQWIGDGCCLYPLFKLPKLTAENIFAIFDIPEDKQGKIFFDEREELPAGLDFSDATDEEAVVTPEKCSIVAEGSTLIPIKCSTGVMLVDKKYLAPFEEDATFYERQRAKGGSYLVVKEGMLLAGVVLPWERTAEIGEWLVNIGELIVGVEEK